MQFVSRSCVSQTLGLFVQVTEQVYPALLVFAEGDLAESQEPRFAAVLPSLCSAEKLTALVTNLLSQLGALCSEETRKATVISGTSTQLAGPTM